MGTLKAGRKRGVLQWTGQMLLKGPHDNEVIRYVGEATATVPAAVTATAPAEAEETKPAEAELVELS